MYKQVGKNAKNEQKCTIKQTCIIKNYGQPVETSEELLY